MSTVAAVDRTQPHNLEAERSVLGVVLVNNDALYAAMGVLVAADFYTSAHQRIFARMVALSERGVGIDFVTLKNELARVGELDAVGGPAYVGSLADGMPTSANVEYYARIVREKSMLRALITAGNRVVASAYEASDDPRLVLDEAERALLAISQEAATGDLLFMDRLVPEAIKLIEVIHDTKQAVTGLSTGLPALDETTRGFHPSNLIVLGARAGDGKSALALQIAWQAARRNLTVAFFSMEMSREELTTRAAAQIARVDHHALMQGRLGSADLQRVGRALNDLANWPLAIDDTSGLTASQVRSKAKAMHSRRGMALIVVDYLQLLRRPRHVSNREEAVSENTWALKALASELRVPVLALSQLNRSSVKEDRRPTLADLRESGAIEQHANVVLLIYKPQAKSDGMVTEQPPVELLVAKQRNGPSQLAIDLHFTGPQMRFDELSEATV